MSSPSKDPPSRPEPKQEGHEDDFDLASLDDLASLLVEALTIPLAADGSDGAEPRTEAAKVRDALPPSAKARH